MVIVMIYCGVIGAMFLLLKTVNYRLHHALDEGEVVEHQAKENQGGRGGTEGANDGGGTRREDSNGPGYVGVSRSPTLDLTSGNVGQQRCGASWSLMVESHHSVWLCSESSHSKVM